MVQPVNKARLDHVHIQYRKCRPNTNLSLQEEDFNINLLTNIVNRCSKYFQPILNISISCITS